MYQINLKLTCILSEKEFKAKVDVLRTYQSNDELVIHLKINNSVHVLSEHASLNMS